MPEQDERAEHRRLPERWVIQVCPACNGLAMGMTTTHSGGCPLVFKSFVSRSVEVEPASRSEAV